MVWWIHHLALYLWRSGSLQMYRNTADKLYLLLFWLWTIISLLNDGPVSSLYQLCIIRVLAVHWPCIGRAFVIAYSAKSNNYTCDRCFVSHRYIWCARACVYIAICLSVCLSDNINSSDFINNSRKLLLPYITAYKSGIASNILALNRTYTPIYTRSWHLSFAASTEWAIIELACAGSSSFT